MRTMLLTVCISLLLALGLGIFCSLYTHHLSRDYRQDLAAVSHAIQSAQWDAALNTTRSLAKDWEKHAGILSLFVSHNEVDAVSLGFSQLLVSLEAKEGYHALLYAAELCDSLDLLSSRDAFMLKNIL